MVHSSVKDKLVTEKASPPPCLVKCVHAFLSAYVVTMCIG